MGCGSSKDADPPRPPPQGGGGGGGGGGNFKTGMQGQVRIEPANPNDPPFMQTASPSGVSWGQYVRNGNSFVDPRTGNLAGPWAECIAWAVIFEHNNDWNNMPQYAADGPVGGVLIALERAIPRQDYMQAAQKLEDACHALADQGQPLPAINQAIQMPPNVVPGQQCQVANPQMPGQYMTLQAPPNAQPGQMVMAPAPVQPNKQGMSTGTKVAYAAGGALAVGAIAGTAYYATAGGGVDGFVGDMSAAGGAIGGAGESAVGAIAGADYGGMAADAGDWAGGAAEDAGSFIVDAGDEVGDFLGDLF